MQIITLLLNAGADIYLTSKDYEYKEAHEEDSDYETQYTITPLHLAQKDDHKEILEAFEAVIPKIETAFTVLQHIDKFEEIPVSCNTQMLNELQDMIRKETLTGIVMQKYELDDSEEDAKDIINSVKDFIDENSHSTPHLLGEVEIY